MSQYKKYSSNAPRKFTNLDFLPMTRADMDARGWEELDILLVSGDAYLDHPAFAAALLGRFLESHGFRVGIVPQPRWDRPDDITELGRPRLFAGISAGAVDSMLAHYTAFRKKRRDDAYTPGGLAGSRPNRAMCVYTTLVRSAFPGLPVVGGGIEASLRRVSHYDFWTDSLRKSVLLDAKLDLLLYGMGERALLEVAKRLDKAVLLPQGQRLPLADVLAGIGGTARRLKVQEIPGYAQSTANGMDSPLLVLPSHETLLENRQALIHATHLLEQQVHHGWQQALQAVGDRAVLLEAPAKPLSTAELDILYALPFTRQAHPAYQEKIPALEMMKGSITCHRGCGGGCSFCSLALHQGRHLASRSEESVLQEAAQLAEQPDVHGSISDVGGPSANMWQGKCALDPKQCGRASCLYPKPCPGFKVDQMLHVDLLRQVGSLPGIRNVRVASGVRFDMLLDDAAALEAYTTEFTGGQLKVAPEHSCTEVLRLMRKPDLDTFEKFVQRFYDLSLKQGKEQYVVPYLISAFPGCTDAHMERLAAYLAKRNWSPQQVQCFIPTPGTMATAMFYSEKDPHGQDIFVARSDAQRLNQHGLLLGNNRDQEREPRSDRRDYAPRPAGPRKEYSPRPDNKGPCSPKSPYSGLSRNRQSQNTGSGQGRPPFKKNQEI